MTQAHDSMRCMPQTGWHLRSARPHQPPSSHLGAGAAAIQEVGHVAAVALAQVSVACRCRGTRAVSCERQCGCRSPAGVQLMLQQVRGCALPGNCAACTSRHTAVHRLYPATLPLVTHNRCSWPGCTFRRRPCCRAWPPGQSPRRSCRSSCQGSPGRRSSPRRTAAGRDSKARRVSFTGAMPVGRRRWQWRLNCFEGVGRSTAWW